MIEKEWKRDKETRERQCKRGSENERLKRESERDREIKRVIEC